MCWSYKSHHDSHHDGLCRKFAMVLRWGIKFGLLSEAMSSICHCHCTSNYAAECLAPFKCIIPLSSSIIASTCCHWQSECKWLSSAWVCQWKTGLPIYCSFLYCTVLLVIALDFCPVQSAGTFLTNAMYRQRDMWSPWWETTTCTTTGTQWLPCGKIGVSVTM